MTTPRTARPSNMPWLIPYLTVQDVDKAMNFYDQAFGFKPENANPGEDGSTWHGEMRYRDAVVMMGKENICMGDGLKSPANSGQKPPITLYLYCDDVDQFYKHALKNGAKSISVPENTFWGDRMCSLSDLDGYVWAFATYLGEASK